MDKKEDLLIETCLLAGRIMMESGSEVYRVEDTMNRIAVNGGVPESTSYVTATGVFMSLTKLHYTQIENVGERSINLEKVAAVNQLSRTFAEKDISLSALYQQLKRIDHETPEFPLQLQIFSACFMSAMLMILYGGNWQSFLATLFIGGLGYATKIMVKRKINIRFLDTFVASLVIGFSALIASHIFLNTQLDFIFIGAVMPLVPGVAITTSLRDILAGHMISGLVRVIEAIIIAAAIAIGIACILSTFGGWL